MIALERTLPREPFAWERTASGYVCPEPVVYEYQGEVWRRDCGRCARCVARKKRDTGGRAAAEAYEAGEVMVWTLTYRDGNPGAVDFVTKDRQGFIKRLRDQLMREARRKVGAPKRIAKWNAQHVRAYWKSRIEEVLPKVRYLGCGERGKRNTMRCHWHICFFLSKPSGFRSTPMERKPNGKMGPGHEHRDLWPFGWCNVDVLPDEMGRKMRAVRYAVKYLDKSQSPKIDGLRRGDKAEAKFFRSSATPLGYAFLVEEARRTAQAGLPLTGKYRVPGVRFSRGKYDPATRSMRPPDLVVNQLTGRMRDHYIAAYREEWERSVKTQPIPLTPWMLRYDSEADMDFGFGRKQAEAGWRARGRDPLVIPPARYNCAGMIPIWGAGPLRGQEVGWIDVQPDGEAHFVDAEGTEHPVLAENLRELVPVLTDKQEAWIKHRLAEIRGPGWMSAAARRRAEHARAVAQTDATRGWAKRGANPMPRHMPPMEPVTALWRKLHMKGNSHIPGEVVADGPVWVDDYGKSSAFIRAKTRVRKGVNRREV